MLSIDWSPGRQIEQEDMQEIDPELLEQELSGSDKSNDSFVFDSFSKES